MKKMNLFKNHFFPKITDLTKIEDVKVMMGDSTVTDQKTFDPKLVMDYFQQISKNLKNGHYKM